MIYYDLSEARVSSNLPNDVIEYGLQFDNLEKLTGADFVIVPEQAEFEKVQAMLTSGLSLIEIAKNLDLDLSRVAKLATDKESALMEILCTGALLVQRKSGFDFVNSMGDRLNHSIAIMNEVSYKLHQRIILVTGNFTNGNGILLVDGKPTNYKYNQFVGAVSAIKYKGACVEFVNDDSCILEWIKIQENQLLSYKRNTTKWIVPTVYYPPDIPDLDDPLQLMIPVRDARLSLTAIPGWGIAKINTLYDYARLALNLNRHPLLFELLLYATDYETANYCKGIGKTLIDNARKYVGLAEGEFIALSKNNVIVHIKRS